MADNNVGRMLFCGTCHNLLYPESDADRKLLWRCNRCKRTEIHNEEYSVFRVNYKREEGGMLEEMLLGDFALDPTSQRDPNKSCIQCGQDDVACFVNPLEQPTEDMSLYFACASCKKVWRAEAKDK